jgi:hypothetical protein
MGPNVSLQKAATGPDPKLVVSGPYLNNTFNIHFNIILRTTPISQVRWRSDRSYRITNMSYFCTERIFNLFF